MKRFRLWNSILAVGCAITFLPVASSADRPNIIMIMTDNHGAWTLGCYGNKEIRTPNIDRLAAEGTLFDEAFASNPVCSPTRASVLTGLLPSQHGVHCFLRLKPLQVGPEARCTLDEFTSLPEVLKDAGYSCGLVGKWHLGANMTPQEGFDDYWITMPHGGTSTFYDAKIIENGKERTEPEYLTDFWTKHAVKYIEQRAADKEKPFFLFLSYNGPYSLSRLLLREGKNRHAEFYRDKELTSFPREAPHPWQLHNRDYQNNPNSIRRVATEVSGVDDGVGTVMETLKAHGLDDNTIVVFLADQGWVGGHGGFFGMGDHTQPKTARDGMMKIPMIWRHPGKIAAGRRSTKLVANYDIMSTLLQHAGIPHNTDAAAPQSPGKSFIEELKATTEVASASASDDEKNDAIFYEFESLRCIRTHDWKYTHRFPNGPHELYDLKNDPDEFDNLFDNEQHQETREELAGRLAAAYAQYASPKYDLYNGGGSQTIIYDGIEEEIAQQETVNPPALPEGFQSNTFTLPEGFSSQLIAGPPLVTHPTMGCFDDRGRLFVCDGAGVNMSAAELEENLPNRINMLEDLNGDGVFDKSTVFADRMTFPMGGAWHDGALYVASPPNIWRLEDTTGDGKADKRDIIVDSFGYTGNAASIHGCFFSPTGRMYWCDGYHGHEFKDKDGNVISKRKGSYIFSCWPDGTDVRIHCGGGMDNPVEVDFTDEGDIIGTVNIMYTRPRIDCLVHWQYGGAYPHREAVLDELKVTGDLLGPIHKFGHVAISGTTRYRSGVMDHRWGNNFFATEFNVGKVVRVELERSGSTYSCTEREFLSCSNRDFHPTDVIEDADGSLLVIDTGGWFYRGCPTSQIAKPDVKGGIYRIRRDGMTTQVDPRGLRTDWTKRTPNQLMRDLKDTRFAVREKVVQECVRRGEVVVKSLISTIRNGDIFARRNAVYAVCQLTKKLRSEGKDITECATALSLATRDRDASIRQSAWHALNTITPSKVLIASSLAGIVNFYGANLRKEESPHVRREAYTTLGRLRMFPTNTNLPVARPAKPALKTIGLRTLESILTEHPTPIDREEEHAIYYAVVENSPAGVSNYILHKYPERLTRNAVIAMDQSFERGLSLDVLGKLVASKYEPIRNAAADILASRAQKLTSTDAAYADLRKIALKQIPVLLKKKENSPNLRSLVSTFAGDSAFAKLASSFASTDTTSSEQQMILLEALSKNSRRASPDLAPFVVGHLNSRNPEISRLAMEAGGNIGGAPIKQALVDVVKSSANSDRQLMALDSLVRLNGKISEDQFELLVRFINNGNPGERREATTTLTKGSLTAPQLTIAASLLRNAGAAQLLELTRLFKRSLKLQQATAFLDNIENARSLKSLPRLEVSEVVKRFPPELHDRANALLDRLQAAEQQKILKLDALVGKLKTGDASRGREVFFSEKSKCATCHVVGRKGKRVGPDLTTIGANRASRDLLESIIFPSSTIVRQYEPYTIVTTNGRTYAGLVIKDTSNAVTIQQTKSDPITVQRSDIEELVPGTVSIMPKGIDEALTQQQIVDLVAWMQSLK